MINITSFNDSKSQVSEAYRTIRTNIQFSQIDNDMKTILVTSSRQDEGKTTVVSNLGVSFATLEGKKVLIIDADFRNPSIHKMFNQTNLFGLTDVLTSKKELEECIQSTELENLQLLTAGEVPPNPGEMLESKRLLKIIDKLKQDYDYIFIDTSPIGIIMDAGSLANYADGTILVIGYNEVEKERVRLAKGRLEKVKANLIGAIFNKYIQKRESDDYYSYYYNEINGKKSFKFNKRKR